MSILGSIAEVLQRPPRTLADLHAAGTVTVNDRSEVPGTFIARVCDEHGEVEYLLSGEQGDPAARVIEWA